ncbi:hypothetical protein BDW02DRAFT_633910 [Decorospora gaudefroyi]|uniref:Uncharacterized protein n=1 Tax=Decorospora gaudefroyi TaxID=184978 RepID=A0A6A5K5P1_9PLEO|nr:hypothetical protein BDW02DRAFT_633910 [Decorospora gaudefroyi]
MSAPNNGTTPSRTQLPISPTNNFNDNMTSNWSGDNTSNDNFDDIVAYLAETDPVNGSANGQIGYGVPDVYAGDVSIYIQGPDRLACDVTRSESKKRTAAALQDSEGLVEARETKRQRTVDSPVGYENPALYAGDVSNYVQIPDQPASDVTRNNSRKRPEADLILQDLDESVKAREPKREKTVDSPAASISHEPALVDFRHILALPSSKTAPMLSTPAYGEESEYINTLPAPDKEYTTDSAIVIVLIQSGVI